MRGKYLTASFSKLVILITGAGVALSAGSWAVAQMPSEAVLLDEVVVTARKREENIQDVPVAVTNLAGENLSVFTSAGVDILALSGRLPSLKIETSNGRLAPRFYIRGLGNVDFDINASQPVSVIVDDMIMENVVAKSFPTFDLERIEMLRGPQGTLFGRNTPAGVVKMVSRRPTEETEGFVRAAYGTYAQTTVEAALSGKLDPDSDLSARISFLYNSMDDWIDNAAPGFEQSEVLGGYDDIAARLQFLWNPSDDFSALLNVFGRDMRDGTPTVFRANTITPGTNELVPGFERDVIFTDAGSRAIQSADHLGAIATLEWDVAGGDYTVTSITGWQTIENLSRGDIDGGYGAVFAPPSGPGFIPFSNESADGLSDYEQVTQELRIASNDLGRLDWQAGFFFFSEDTLFFTSAFDSLAGGVLLFSNNTSQKANAYGLFGSIDYEISDTLNLTVGLRYSDDEKEYFTTDLGGASVAPSDSAVTGDVSLTYALNDDINLYGRLATGFRAPSVANRFGSGLSVGETETITSIEGGIKSDLLDGRLRLNAALYLWEMSDQQLTAVGGVANATSLINADTTNGQGFEVELQWIPDDNWLVSLATSFNDTEIDDPDLTTVVGGSGPTVLDPTFQVPGDFGPVTIAQIDGNPLVHAPEWLVNLTLRYGYPTANGEVFFHTDWAYQSEANFTLYEAVEFRDDMIEGGIRVGYAHNGGQYEIAAYGRNITDDESLIGMIDFINLTGFVNMPRLFGIEFTYRMGY
jgi:iron complex outermembrane receptor protein